MNPIWSFFRTLGYLLTARFRFTKKRVGDVYTMEDGREYKIFRHVSVSRKSKGQSPAVFKVSFLLANMTPQQNKLFSLIPIPFFTGLPGFREKFWMIDEKEGYFQGLYEWDSFLSAQKYSKSFAMRFMNKRSVPGTAKYEILTDKKLEDYITTLQKKIVR